MFGALLGVLSLVSGCTTLQTIPVEERTETYNAPVADVFRAVVDAFTEMGYPIDDIDREMGAYQYGLGDGASAGFGASDLHQHEPAARQRRPA